MSVDGVLRAGRAAAEQLLRDTCTVTRSSGQPVLDEETGEVTQATTTVYTGACRIKPRSAREAEWGEREVALHQYVAVLPWDASPEIQHGDTLTVAASDDGWLEGRPLEVIAIGLAGTATARRLLVEDKEG
jgi:hypothetical protein